jgi:uncharacterized protein (TIGR03083 family)
MTSDQFAITRAIDALEDSLGETIALCEMLSRAQWRLPTTCPGWTVHDQVAHLAGLESALLGRARPAHALPVLPHVVTDAHRETELDVDLRRAHTSLDVLEELREVSALRMAKLRASPPDPSRKLPFLGGVEVPAALALQLRVCDVWTHGEDIRRAVGADPDLGAPAAEITTELFLRGFARAVENLAPPDGSVIVLEITEPFPSTQVIAFDTEPTNTPTVMLRMDVANFTALSAGRILPADATVEIEGDRTLARAILAAMVVTP